MTNLFNDKVCLDALECLVGLLLQDKDDITRLDAWLTVACLSPQHNLGIVLVPLLYVHLEDLLLWQQPLQPTSIINQLEAPLHNWAKQGDVCCFTASTLCMGACPSPLH